MVQLVRLLLAAILGVIAVFAFAPWGYWPLAVVSLTGLFALVVHLRPGQTFFVAWAFGAAFFSFGLHWLYISVHVSSPAPAPAMMAVGVVALLTVPLGLFFALPFGLAARFIPDVSSTNSNVRANAAHQIVLRLLLTVALLALFDWLRSWFLTGFPWLSLGFSQIDSPLAGFAPIGGVHLITLLLSLTAAAFVLLVLGSNRVKIISISGILIVWLAGFFLHQVQWVESTDKKLTIALVQANIPQEKKWDANYFPILMNRYIELSRPLLGEVDAIIWPEAAVPQYYNAAPKTGDSPYFMRNFPAAASAANTDLILGTIWQESDSVATGAGVSGRAVGANIRRYNSMVHATANNAVYHKRHLVPFGEYSPLPDSMTEMIRNMGLPAPYGVRGELNQPLLTIHGSPVGMSICYEDVFSRDILRDLPEAEILINASNDSWFAVENRLTTDLLADSTSSVGQWLHTFVSNQIDNIYRDSPGPHQHHEIARMRAAETRRYMARSTSTGISGFIDPYGQTMQVGQQFVAEVLVDKVEALRGRTPFVWWGHWLMVGLSCLILLLCFIKRRVLD